MATAPGSTSPWYRLVDSADTSLEQGDILFRFRYVAPTIYAKLGSKAAETDISIVKADVIVLTASCDLANPGKIDYVLLCPHWDFEDAVKNPALGVKQAARQNIEKGFQPRHCLLSSCDLPGCTMGVRVVDFNRVFPIPRALVDAHVAQGVPRLRMNAPYREHVAQAFGICYTRVGLPQRATET